MKKIITFAAVFFASVALFAIDHFNVGARMSVDINLFDVRAGDYDADMKPDAGIGVNILANIDLKNGFCIQPEIGFHHHKIMAKFKNGDREAHYKTLDAVVLAAYRYDLCKYVFLQPAVGPRVSATLDEMNGDKEFDYGLLYYFNFGIDVGLTVGINVGPGAALVDFRFENDFTKFIADTDDKLELGIGRQVYISLGYQFKIK